MTAVATDNSALNHALYYASLGWRIIPILPGQKRPGLGHGLSEWQTLATTDTELITQWYTQWPDHGVGIACGPESGIFVLDVDPRNGGDDSLAELIAAHGPLPDTVEAITGGNGRHIFFAWPAITEAQRLTNSSGRLGPGLDVKSAGGQVVAAPTIHPDTGAAYCFEMSSLPGDVPVAEAPPWLLALIVEDTAPLPEGQIDGYRGDGRAAWDRYRYEDGANERSIALLEAAGWTRGRTDRRDGWTAMTRPGKPGGVSASVGRIAPGVVRVFTSEGAPLVLDGTYDPPGLLAALHHNGDRVAADRALVADGWGEPTHSIDQGWMDEWVAASRRAVVATELREAHALLAEPEEPYDWLVEGLIERGDRLILTGPEGGGKSTLLRQMAVQIASGVHPFDGAPCRPARVLIIDCENSTRHIKRKLRPLVDLAAKRLAPGRLWIVPKPEGIDLGTPSDANWLSTIVAEVEPELLIIGPIYKMSDGDPIEEQTAKVVIRSIDMLRARHDCAVLIEAHTPHDSKTERPYGASVWKRWPEFGLYLDRRGPLRHWRGARDERDWPAALTRGVGKAAWPWEKATDKAITFVRMMEIQRSAAKKMSSRAIAEALQAQGIAKGAGASHTTVQAAIKANIDQWNDLLDELGFTLSTGGEE